MGQITTTQNLVAIKEVRHAGQKLSLSNNNCFQVTDMKIQPLVTDK